MIKIALTAYNYPPVAKNIDMQCNWLQKRTSVQCFTPLHWVDWKLAHSVWMCEWYWPQNQWICPLWVKKYGKWTGWMKKSHITVAQFAQGVIMWSAKEHWRQTSLTAEEWALFCCLVLSVLGNLLCLHLKATISLEFPISSNVAPSFDR